VLAKLDPSAFQTCFLRWIDAIGEKLPGDVIALDGKTSLTVAVCQQSRYFLTNAIGLVYPRMVLHGDGLTTHLIC